jgi:hypothetical protein
MAYVDNIEKLDFIFRNTITDAKMQLIFIQRQISFLTKEFIEEREEANKKLWLKDISILNAKYLDALLRIACDTLGGSTRWSKSAILDKGTNMLKHVMHMKDRFVVISNAIKIVDSIKSDTH